MLKFSEIVFGFEEIFGFVFALPFGDDDFGECEYRYFIMIFLWQNILKVILFVFGLDFFGVEGHELLVDSIDTHGLFRWKCVFV